MSTPLRTQSESSRARPAATLVASGLALVFLLVTIFYSLPSNVLLDRGVIDDRRAASVHLMPQGWAFFTRPPSSEEFIPVAKDGEVIDLLETPMNKPSNLFGASREQRAQMPEIAYLVNSIEPGEWTECQTGSAVVECLAEPEASEAKLELVNETHHKSLCGNISFAEVTPVDWSFRDLYDDSWTANHVVTVEVQC